MTEIFISKVDSQGQIGWIVTPQIINDDGQQHDQIEVVAAGGITPKVGDYVFVQTIKNNLDFSNINQYFKANRANGVIIDIATSFDGKYYLEGDRIIDGKAEIKGNTRSLVTHAELKTQTDKLASDIAAAFAQVNAVIGVPIPVPGVYPITIDITSAKTDNIKTGPEV